MSDERCELGVQIANLVPLVVKLKKKQKVSPHMSNNKIKMKMKINS